MGVECASCGQVIPSGQFRCGSCGAAQPRASFEDYGGLSELAVEPARSPSQDLPPIGPAATATARAPAVAAEPARAGAAQAEEDDGAREPAVPRGTFASVVPDSSEAGEEREGAKPAAERELPKQVAKPALQSAAPPQSKTKSSRPPTRPPYLASEILREDLTPTEPGRKHMDVMLHLAPALGALAVLSSGIHRVATWVSMAALAGMFLLTRFEVSYFNQAVLVAAIGGVSLAGATSARVALGGGYEGPLLAAAATLLPGALLFRSWFRAAYTARVLVALALVLALTWATWTSHRNLLALEFSWESWVPALAWYVFCILCLLALLAFMSEETTGGCDVWALGLWVWYGLYACTRFALEGELGGQPHDPNMQTLGLLEPALAAPTSVALAQLFARTFVSRPSKS